MAPAHILPADLPSRLDLRQPPADPEKARGYAELVALLEELGQELDRSPEGGVSDFRDWERRVAAILRSGEIDLFMRAPDEDGYDVSRLPEQRWRNLWAILLRRKGFR